MTKTWLATVDPGMSTGIALGWFNEYHPYERVGVWQVEGGLEGWLAFYYGKAPMELYAARFVVERFILRDNDFIANTEPLRIEGSIETLGLHPIYQLRTDKALCKDEVLKKHDLWVTGKQVGCKDGRDACDATIHALAYMKKLKHRPSLRFYW